MKFLHLVVLLPGCDFIFTFLESQDTGTSVDDTGNVGIPADCSAYDFFGEIYDCTLLDDPCVAIAAPTPTRLACCDCDPEYCNPVFAECTDDTGRGRGETGGTGGSGA